MSKLRKLEIRNSKVETGSFECVKNLKNIRDLCICGINDMDNRDVSGIGTLKRLSSLMIEECVFAPGSLKHLKDLVNLEYLSVSKIRLDQDDMQGIGSMTNLVNMYVHDCSIDAGVFAHLKSLKRLETLCLSCYSTAKIKLCKVDVAAIGSMVSLAMLGVSLCEVEAESLECL